MKEHLKSVEIEGKTVEAAILKGLKMLNVQREMTKIKVVCEEKKGLFGMDGAKPAKVIITIKKEKA